jgi:hypothetical protein
VRNVADSSARLAMTTLLVAVALAPFEWRLTRLAGFTLTTSEAAVIAAVLSAAIRVRAQTARRAALSMPLVVPGAIWLAATLAAALFASSHQDHALRFVARMVMAASLFAATVTTVSTRRDALVVVRTLVVVGTALAVIAVLEVAQVQLVMNALTAFRQGFHVVGGQLRATSTFSYPTIASMYLELAFGLGTWLLFEPSRHRPRLARALAFAALVIIGAGIAATFTRAGLIGMAACLALVALLRAHRLSREDARLRLVGALALALLSVVLLSRSPQLLMTRLGNEGSGPWYGARYQVPSVLRLDTGRIHTINATLTNTGRLTWDSRTEPSFAMSYHWLRARSEAVVEFDGLRTPFPSSVSPGATVQLPVTIRAPGEAGDYTLVWDVVHEGRSWLSTEGVASPRTSVRVDGPPAGTVRTTMARLPSASVRPARPALWWAAAQIGADRPVLGIGPDTYRFAYGAYLGLDRWDDRVHANNMYLDALAGTGVLGVAALIWLTGLAGWRLLRRSLRGDETMFMPSLAALCAWLMFSGHGLVDSFLSFTPCYVAFAVTAGLAFSPGLALRSEEDNAYRV